MVTAAASRGIHVYMEKPFCRTLAEADEIVQVCEANRVKLAIAFQTRYSPIVSVIHGLLDNGAIGDVLEVRGRGKEDARAGGTDLMVLGSMIARIGEQFSTLRGNFGWISDINRQLARITGNTTGAQVIVAGPSMLEQVAFATPTVTPVVKALLIANIGIFLLQWIVLEGFFPAATASLTPLYDPKSLRVRR